ncbi:AzlD domain-containing protein [uncultured Planktomarina sp.]|uniref:AzlD domain-containing protein n=1 Tax=uncultured Planktomarina sp. TaxID=1538529 RepID=UPI0032601A94
MGTFAIRFSFLGLIGSKRMAPVIERMLRFTPVAVLPGMVAPLVLWPTDAADGVTLLHLAAASAAVGTAYLTRKVIWGMLAGLGVFFAPVIFALL